MRLVIMGTSAFAVPSMKAVLEAGHEVAAVYTQPPRPKGRGHRPQPTAMHEAATGLGLFIKTPVTLRGPEAQAELRALDSDLAIVGAYGLLLPQSILDTPRFGCINLHASALPRWRGAAPIHRAILAGDEATGVSIFQMEAGLDTGPVLAMERIRIAKGSTASELHDHLADLAARMIPKVLSDLSHGEATPQPQPEEGMTYAHKIIKADGELNFSEPAAMIERRTRAMHPWPGCWCAHGETRINLLHGSVVEGVGAPGELIAEPMTIACGEQAFRVDRLQRQGRKAMSPEELRRGFAIPLGAILS